MKRKLLVIAALLILPILAIAKPLPTGFWNITLGQTSLLRLCKLVEAHGMSTYIEKVNYLDDDARSVSASGKFYYEGQKWGSVYFIVDHYSKGHCVEATMLGDITPDATTRKAFNALLKRLRVNYGRYEDKASATDESVTFIGSNRTLTLSIIHSSSDEGQSFLALTMEKIPVVN